jgi:lysophospholipase L1-like esterase
MGGGGWKIMRHIKWIVFALSYLAGAASPAAGSGLVLGDSHGEGLAQASGLKGLARISVHIRGPRALEQLAQTPPGSTVFLVLGTNDADGSIAKLDRHIDNIVQAAARKDIKLVWIGPPCVQKPWDTRARELDGILSATLAAKSVQYVSMRDERLCSGSLHEPDGVHLKMKGYAYMWEKARSAAGFLAAVAERKETDKSAESPVVEHKPAKKHARKAGGHAKRSTSVSATPPTGRAQMN